MRLSVRHTTLYRYPGPVRENTNELRLLPRSDLPRQQVLTEELRVAPAVTVFFSVDYWGNRVAHFNILRPHTELLIESQVTVETFAHQDLSGYQSTPLTPDEQHALIDYLRPTPLTTLPAEPGALGLEAAHLREQHPDLPGFLDALAACLHTSLRYEPGTTTVETTVAEVLAHGGGVCQDFSHLFIALCRAEGIPARYAGGYHYLGPGAARHENHAWAEAYLPGAGWVGWDPANGTRVGEAHLQVTAGRDYADVSPVRGTYRGPGGSTLEVRLEMQEI